MLEKLIIKNFQCHKHKTIEFDQITTLTGVNDVGKSAILRALRWLCTNKPTGNDFINWDSDYCKVLGVFDGNTIIRKKGKSNTYRLNEESYRAFGSTVPGDILHVLNISEASWSDQHDAVFQLSQSPGQISKSLNAIINLEVIDNSLSKISSKVRLAKTTVEVSERRLCNAVERKKSLSWALDLDKKLEVLKVKEKDLELIRQNVLGLSQLLETGLTLTNTLKSGGERILRACKGLKTVGPKIKESESLHSLNVKLKEDLEEWAELHWKTARTEIELDGMKNKWEQVKKEMKVCILCNQPIR